MTSPVPLKLRLGRAAFKWSLIAALVLFAGMAASLFWNVLWPVWSDPAASEARWAMAKGVAATILINAAIVTIGIALVGWVVRFALTRERTVLPGRRDGD